MFKLTWFAPMATASLTAALLVTTPPSTRAASVLDADFDASPTTTADPVIPGTIADVNAGTSLGTWVIENPGDGSEMLGIIDDSALLNNGDKALAIDPFYGGLNNDTQIRGNFDGGDVSIGLPGETLTLEWIWARTRSFGGSGTGKQLRMRVGDDASAAYTVVWNAGNGANGQVYFVDTDNFLQQVGTVGDGIFGSGTEGVWSDTPGSGDASDVAKFTLTIDGGNASLDVDLGNDGSVDLDDAVIGRRDASLALADNLTYFFGGSSAGNKGQYVDDVLVDYSVTATNIDSWITDADGNWNNVANWNSGSVPNSATAQANLAGISITDARTVTVDADISVNEILIDGANQYTIADDLDGGTELTLAGTTPAVNVGSGTHVISAGLFGTAGLTKTGGGTLTLSGDNSNLTGTIDVQAGRLNASTLNSANNAVNVSSGATFAWIGDDLGGGAAGTFANAITGSGTVVFGDSQFDEVITLTNDNSSFTGTVDVNGNGVFGGSGPALRAAANNAFGGASATAEVGGSLVTAEVSGGVTLANQWDLGGRAGNNNPEAVTDPHINSVAGSNALTGDISVQNNGSNIGANSGSTLNIRSTISDGGTDPNNEVGTVRFLGEGNVVVGQVGTPNQGKIVGSDVDVVMNMGGSGSLTIATAVASSDTSNATGSFWGGTTTIQDGTLIVDSDGTGGGELASSAISVAETTTLDVSAWQDDTGSPAYNLQVGQALSGGGTIDAGTGRLGVFGDNIVTPGDSKGTLNVAGGLSVLGIDAGGTAAAGFNFELDAASTTAGAGVNDLVDVTGDLTVSQSGGTGQMFVNIESDAGGLSTASDYTLIDYAGSLSGDPTAVLIAQQVNSQGDVLNTRQTVTIVNNVGNSSVDLSVSGATESRTWQGGSTAAGDGTWEVGGSNTEWIEGDQLFQDLDDVTFTTVAGGDGFNDVDISGDVTPGSIIIDGTDDYFFNSTATGDGIVGAASLTKNGTGSTTISNSGGDNGDGNQFSGAVNINAGTLVFRNNQSGIAGDFTIAGGATLQIGNEFGGGRLGSNNIDLQSGGTITVVDTPDNEFNALLSGAGAVNVQNESLNFTTDMSGYSGTITSEMGGSFTFNATASGTFDPNSSVVLNGGNMNVFPGGGERVLDSEVTVADGNIRVGNDGGSQLLINGDVTVTDTDSTFRSDGSAGLRLNGNVALSGASVNLTFQAGGGPEGVAAGDGILVSGIVSGDGGITKTETGQLQLDAANTYSGNTTVAAGTLTLGVAGSIANSATIDVQPGGTLDVSAVAGGFSVASGQTLNNDSNTTVDGNVTAGSGSTVSGKGTFANDVTAESGSIVRVGIAGVNPASNTVVSGLFDGGNGTTYDGSDDPAADGQAEYVKTFTFTDGIATFTADVRIAAGGGDGTLTAASSGHMGVTGSNGTISQAGEKHTFTVENIVETTDTGATIDFDGFTTIALYFTSEDSDAGALTDNSSDIWSFDGKLGDIGGAKASGNTTDDNAYTWTGTSGNVHADVDVSGSLPETLVAEWRTNTTSGNNRWRTNSVGGQFTVNRPAVADTLTILGDYTQQAGATLEIGIFDPNTADLLDVTGMLTAAGELEVTLDGTAPAPGVGDTFDILDFGSASGAFSLFTLPGLDPGLKWDTNELLVDGTLSVASNGDFNLDGTVDGLDFLAWQRGDSPDPLSQSDLLSWQENFGQSFPLDATSTTVPEPTSGLLLVLAVVALNTTRRGGRK